MLDNNIQPYTEAFSSAERLRYQRHFQLAGFSAAGQEKLKHARVLIVGVGGLGCPAAQYLAAAGVGRLTLLDADDVSLSNLQRQILFTVDDVGAPKALVAKRRLEQLNNDITITAITELLNPANAATLIAQSDLIIDCTDNFHTRFLINDVCAAYKKPWLYSSVLGFSGQLGLFAPGKACFRCVFPEVSEVADCNQAGVLGVVPGLLGVLQATEAIKFLTDLPGSISNQLMQIDALAMSFKSIKLSRDEDCVICSGLKGWQDNLTDYHSQGYLPEYTSRELTSGDVARQLKNNTIVLIDVRSTQEHQQDNIGGESVPLELITSGQYCINSDQQYLFYCQSGARSMAAVIYLLNNNINNVWSLSGGLTAWYESAEPKESL